MAYENVQFWPPRAIGSFQLEAKELSIRWQAVGKNIYVTKRELFSEGQFGFLLQEFEFHKGSLCGHSDVDLTFDGISVFLWQICFPYSDYAFTI